MPADERWKKLTPADWVEFAKSWLAELKAPSGNDQADVSGQVVLMNFTATAEQQWKFILAATSISETDDELGHIAAGPVEHLLWKHGQYYIDVIEHEVSRNPNLARVLTGVWNHGFDNEVWTRVQLIQKTVADPLQASDENADLGSQGLNDPESST